MKRILTFFSVALIVVAGTVSCNNDPKADGLAQIKSFSLQSSLNSTLSSDVTGVLDETARTISLVLPEGSGSSFIPTFTVTDDDVVKAGSTVVTSGVTSISVTDGVQLSVTDEVSELNVTYTLSVKENDGAAELKSISFLKADNSVLTADVIPEAIASEMIARVPSAAFKQELVLTVEAGLNDVVKVNGKDVESGKATVDTSFPIDITVTDAVAGTSASYILKVGKVLEYVVSKVGTISDGTKIFPTFDIKINPKDGTPWIAYYKELEGDKYDRVAVVRLDGTSFPYVGESCISADIKDAKNPALAFASDGTAFLKYAGGEVTNRNTVKKFSSTTWEVCGKEGINSVNINTSYPSPLYIQSNGHPAFFFTANAGELKRSIVSSYFNGTDWIEKPASASGIAPKYGEPSDKAGAFYGSAIAEHNGKTYMLSSFNEWGYMVYEVGEECALTPIVYNYKPGTSSYGVPGNMAISSDGDEMFVFAADISNSKMQVYKVDFAGKTLTEYGAGLNVSFDKYGSAVESATFSTSNTGLKVATIEDSDHNVYFKYLNSSLQWEDITISEKPVAIASNGHFHFVFNADGTGYIAYTSANGIEVYKVALEADVLPE